MDFIDSLGSREIFPLVMCWLHAGSPCTNVNVLQTYCISLNKSLGAYLKFWLIGGALLREGA